VRRARAGGRVPCCLLSTCALLASHALAQPEPMPEQLSVELERCAGLPFDAAAYLESLDVELATLGVGAAAPAPQMPALVVRAPDCDARIELSLRIGERTQVEQLRSDEFQGPGRERALALATIERLRQSFAALSAASASAAPVAGAATPAAVPAPAPASQSAPTSTPAPQGAPAPTASAAPRRTPSGSFGRSTRAGASGAASSIAARSALSAALRFSSVSPLSSLGLSVDHTLTRVLALGGVLAWNTERTGLDAARSDGHALTLGPRAELSLLDLGALAFAGTLGLAPGLAWVVTERAGASSARVSSSPAPVVLATTSLAVRASLALDAYAQLGVAADWALLGARFASPGGRRLAAFTGLHGAVFVGVGTRFGT